ncbi:MAG TPA: sensor histidine kinase [Actinomycetota bacterium]|nr:sensor histidine kinase [Actinomycetota bacterium]
MTDPGLRRLGWIVTAAEAALLIVVFVITLANGSFSSEGGFIAIAIVMLVGYGAIGGYLAIRLPRNPIGWLLLVVAGAFALAALSDEWVTYTYVTNRGNLPLGGFMAWVTNWIFLLAVWPIPLILVLFPTGRAPSARWRWLLVAFSASMTIGALGTMLRPGDVDANAGIVIPNPTGVESLGPALDVILTAAGVVALVAALVATAAPFVRFRRAGGEERQQLRWLAYVTSAAAVAFVVAIFTGIGLAANETRLANEIAFYAFFVLLGVGIPAAIGVALLKYRLWDLDIVVKKAVVAAIVVIAFASLSVLALVVIGGALVGPIGDRPGVTLLAGLVIGAALWPILRLSRRIADRVVYGGRATPYEVLTEFSDRLAETYSNDDVLPRTAAILGEGTGADRVTIWLLIGGEAVPAATWPANMAEPAPGPDAFEVRHQGELLGSITVSMPANDPMNPSKERLIRDLTGQAGLVLRNVRLIEELRASRRRLVAAQDQERRRVERNIHDGAQQQLVALAVKLRLADQMVDRDATKARELLAQLQSDTHDALETLRDLARGIYPPLLADKGLSAALDAQARKSSIPVVVEPDGVSRYAEEIEATVYFCVLEALQNISKYAEADTVTIALEERGERLAFEVRDDGIGFDPETAPRGTGLQGMADRLDAIGGELRIRSARGQGTTVAGTVPLTASAGRSTSGPVPVVEPSGA